MNIRKYEAYVRAVELGSLSKAAEQLGYTQSGMSHMMQSLEEEDVYKRQLRHCMSKIAHSSSTV